MIVFGTRGKVIPGPRKQGAACASCGHQEHATYGILRYFHVFWVPVFPTKKDAAMECLNCKKTLVGKDVPERVRGDIKETVFTGKRVIPMFSGLALAAIAFAFLAVAGMQQSEKEAAYLQAPAANDYYVVKLTKIYKDVDGKYPYGLLKVRTVADGKVEVLVGNYGYTGASGAYKAIRGNEVAKNDYFGNQVLAIPVAELQNLKQDGTIYSVRRP